AARARGWCRCPECSTPGRRARRHSPAGRARATGLRRCECAFSMEMRRSPRLRRWRRSRRPPRYRGTGGMRNGGRRESAEGVCRGDRAESGDLLLHLTTLRPFGWFGESLLRSVGLRERGLETGAQRRHEHDALVLELEPLRLLAVVGGAQLVAVLRVAANHD